MEDTVSPRHASAPPILLPVTPSPSWATDAYMHFTGRPDAEPVMAALAAKHGVIQYVPDSDVYGRLVRAIVGQQISGKAATAIRRRVLALAGDPPAPTAMAALDDASLLGCGLSNTKLLAIRDLTARTLDGRLEIDRIPMMPDEEIITHVIQVRGVGRWTAEMLLIFGLARPDVLPVDDLGIRAGIQRAYGLDALPKPAEMRALAEPWRPFATAASSYLWRSLDNLTP